MKSVAYLSILIACVLASIALVTVSTESSLSALLCFVAAAIALTGILFAVSGTRIAKEERAGG